MAGFEAKTGSWKGFALVLVGLAALIALFFLVKRMESSASSDKFMKIRNTMNAVSSYQLTVRAESIVGSASSSQLLTTYSRDGYSRLDNIVQMYGNNVSETRIYVTPAGAAFLCKRPLENWACLPEENLTAGDDKLLILLARRGATEKDAANEVNARLANSGIINFRGSPKNKTIAGRTCNELDYEIRLDLVSKDDLEYLGSFYMIASLTDKAEVNTCLDAESGLPLHTLITAETRDKKSGISIEMETVSIEFGNDIPDSVFELPD